MIPVDGIRRAARLALQDGNRSLSYTEPAGLPSLRAWVAAKERATPEHVLITNGSLQALDFTARVLLKHGDRVVVEAPTYDYSIAVFRRAGVRLAGVPVQDDGLDVDRFEATLKREGPPIALYLIPTFQNPSGVCLSAAKRERLVELAQHWGFMILEDDPYRELRFGGDAVPTLRELWPDGEIVHLTSFTKTIAPGLRCGAAVGPPRLIELLAHAARHTYISPGSVAQAIVAAYCSAGLYEAGVAKIADKLVCRRDALVGALQAHLGDRVELATPQGGYFLWASVDDDSARFAARARRAGIHVVAGSQFFLDGNGEGDRAIRLAFASAGAGLMDEAATRLAACLQPAPDIRSGSPV